MLVNASREDFSTVLVASKEMLAVVCARKVSLKLPDVAVQVSTCFSSC